MKKFTAIILNIVYPGAGYLYLKDPERDTIAKFLVLVWTALVAILIYQLIGGLITGNFYWFGSDMRVPILAVIMWGAMCIDTYRRASQSN